MKYIISTLGCKVNQYETQEDGLWTGHSDSYVLVSSPGENLRGQIRQVLISEVRGDQLFGHLDD